MTSDAENNTEVNYIARDCYHRKGYPDGEGYYDLTIPIGAGKRVSLPSIFFHAEEYLKKHVGFQEIHFIRERSNDIALIISHETFAANVGSDLILKMDGTKLVYNFVLGARDGIGWNAYVQNFRDKIVGILSVLRCRPTDTAQEVPTVSV